MTTVHVFAIAAWALVALGCGASHPSEAGQPIRVEAPAPDPVPAPPVDPASEAPLDGEQGG